LSWKLANFARLDPSLQQRQIIGAPHGGKGEIEVWNEFNSNWDSLAFESEKLHAKLTGKGLEELAVAEIEDSMREGRERNALVRIRVNQSFFRSAVLAAYDNQCCITGLSVPELLNASHIAPWSVDIPNRVNPRNGLCLNAIHDRAFDRGLITITSDYKVSVSSILKSARRNVAVERFILDYDGASIQLPQRFVPSITLLQYHNAHVFRA